MYRYLPTYLYIYIHTGNIIHPGSEHKCQALLSNCSMIILYRTKVQYTTHKHDSI